MVVISVPAQTDTASFVFSNYRRVRSGVVIRSTLFHSVLNFVFGIPLP